MVHGFLPHAGSLDGNREVLFQLALSGEIRQTARAQARLELQVLRLLTAGDQALLWHCPTSLPYQFQSPAKKRLELSVSSGGLRFTNRGFGLRSRAAEVQQRGKHVLIDLRQRGGGG